MLTPSSFAPEASLLLPPVPGVLFATAETQIRYRDRPDVLLAAFTPGTQTAGVFTRSATAAAPVLDGMRKLAHGTARGLVVNAGNANAFTGASGNAAVTAVSDAAAAALGCTPGEIFVSSTGVIGEPLPYGKITAALPSLQEALSPEAWNDAAEAICTTDTFPKLTTRTATIGGVTVTLNGIAKGSGMIAPNMATMLGFLFTDAAIPATVLQSLLSDMTPRTFNAITVDGDTSTNDTVLAFATGQAEHPAVRRPDDEALSAFRIALESLMQELALLIVKDGEGISKLLTVRITGAASNEAARKVAFAIANSPLVKTGVAGEDPNWGRIIMAVGNAGVPIMPERIRLWIGEIQVTQDGGPHPNYREEDAARVMRAPEVTFHVDLGMGEGEATVWTTDLTHGYIEINADYRS